MSIFIKQNLRGARPNGWFDRLMCLLARELALSSRKVRTALRITTIATLGAGIVASCHVNNELGVVFVWLLAGAGPMMSPRRGVLFLAAEGFALAVSVVTAGVLAETPWFMLPYLFAVLSFSTYLGSTRKLGASLILIEIVCLNSFYGVVFAPKEIGWSAAGAFGGSAIAVAAVVLFDNWLWPDPGEGVLLESLETSITKVRARLLEASSFYLTNGATSRPQVPPPTSDLPAHMALLDQAMAEGVSRHRHATLLAAITRVARIALEVDRLIVTVRQDVAGQIQTMARPELPIAVEAVAAALDDHRTGTPKRNLRWFRPATRRIADKGQSSDGRSFRANYPDQTDVHRYGEF